ncbi:hypothetical protein [Streptomyces sp. NPDC050848]|uniref:hypothetical protein n=1 Tax=Streptomyces sp. NPDC050848 TaxID=3155791 RepID=UPI0033F6441B
MPGSTTLGPGHGVDAIEHLDAVRVKSLMKELHRLLTVSGPDRITDAQVTALRGDAADDREAFTDWVGRVAHDLEKATA